MLTSFIIWHKTNIYSVTSSQIILKMKYFTFQENCHMLYPKLDESKFEAFSVSLCTIDATHHWQFSRVKAKDKKQGTLSWLPNFGLRKLNLPVKHIYDHDWYSASKNQVDWGTLLPSTIPSNSIFISNNNTWNNKKSLVEDILYIKTTKMNTWIFSKKGIPV